MNRRASQFAPLFYQEPFRIFFPTGLLLGIAGVALWPAYYFGLTATYPSISHARLMIEGFMALFIIGFLGTAGPRMTSTSPFARKEVLVLLTLDLLAAGLHFGESHRAGDVLFVICMAFFLFAIGKRFVRRQDSPLPNFALVGLGLLNGFAGAILVAFYEDKIYSIPYRVGIAFLEQGFVLFPILGVAPFFMRRLLEIPLPNDLPDTPKLPPGWMTRAAFAVAVGVIIDATFVGEVFGATIDISAARFAAILLYLLATLPWQGRTFLADCLRLGIAAIVIGIGVEAMWPQYRIGALHILFISGFSFVAFTVAIRVVFGHSGRTDLLQKPLPFFVIAGVLIFLAMLSRYSADLAPKARTMHLIAAAICWLIAAVIWSLRVIPKVTIVEPEE